MPDATQTPPSQPSTKLQLLAQALREMGILPQPSAPTQVPLGSGLAQQAAGALAGRQQQIDAQIAANGG